MALLILSREIQSEEETLYAIQEATGKAGIGYREVKFMKNNLETYVYNEYDAEEQYFYLGIENEVDIINNYDVLDLHHNGNKFYRLAVSDQADYDLLMYDFTLAYLRSNPKHCISFYGDFFFYLEDMEGLEKTGGFRKKWCFTPNLES
jgi:hypothetical protein